MKKRKKKSEIPNSKAILLLILGIIMGSVFIFVYNYFNGNVDREDAESVTVTYESYEEKVHRSRYGRDYYAVLSFSDYKDLDISQLCYNDEVEEKLEALPKGAILNVIHHPRSDDIMELRHYGNCILSFDEVSERIHKENIGFFCLGVFMYFCALFGLCILVGNKIRGNKESLRKKQKGQK